MKLDLLSLSPGDRLLDRFRIDAAFTGGLGLLWAVTDADTGRRYAVKTIKPIHLDNRAVVEGFRQEALIWIALDRHDHLVQALWLIEKPVPFLVLEYVAGSDLARILAGGPLGVARAVDLALQCAAGLDYAHGKAVAGGIGVVHRDLKPSNLLVTERDLLKVTDFGLARVYRRDAEPGLEDEVRAGTPAYMAPEQLGRAGTFDGRADIYSFGLVLYEMIAGFNPLQADDLPAQIERTLHAVPPPLADAPAPLAALVARCVAKDPAERPRDFKEVSAHLARVARELDHPWHVDPAGIREPERPAGLVVSGPVLHPRRPQTGEPFTAELDVRGDVGRGPVEVAWRITDSEFPVLSPGGETRRRIEAGGRVHLRPRLQLLAARKGVQEVGESRVVVEGPDTTLAYRVPAFRAEVAYAFVLPWVGRRNEWSRIRLLLERRGGTLFVYGGIGLGKSRLLVEVARGAAVAGLRAVSSRAHERGMRPMRVLNDLARDLLGLARDETARVRSAVNDLLGDDPPTARYFAEVLLGGVALEHEAPLAHRWYALLRAAARRERLVLLLDDLHFADEAAIRVVLELAARAQRDKLPVAIIGTARAGSRETAARARERALRETCDAWRRRGAKIEEIELEPLSRAAVAQCIEAAFPGHGFAEEAPWLLGTVVAATRGNPFHVIEILRALRRGVVARREGEWRLDPGFTPEALHELVPAGLGDAVSQRLGALSPETRKVLRLAALIGEEFTARLVRAAARDPAAVDRALSEMEEAEIIAPFGPGRVGRYRFWSATVPAVVQRALSAGSEAESRRAHRAVADGMLRVYRGADRIRRALGIAHHLRRAGQGRRSLPFTLAGCERLLSLQLAERARRLLANAEPLVDDTEVTPALRAYFHYLYGLACETTGEYETGRAALTRFLESGVRLPGDPRAVPRAHVRLGRILQNRGEYEGAEASLLAARAEFQRMGDRRKLAFVFASLAELQLERGKLSAAGEHLKRARRLAQETGNEGAAIHALILRGRIQWILARPAEARRALLEAEERAQALGDRRRRAMALRGLAQVALESGYLRQAQRWIEKAIDLHALLGARPGLADSLLLLGDVQRARRDLNRALRHYRRAQRVFREMSHPDGMARAMHRVGLLLRSRGRTTHAVRELAAAAEEYGRLGLPERFAVLHDLGRALADAGSERLARLALARADRGMAPGPLRRRQRVLSRTVRSRLALARRDLRAAGAWAQLAQRAARRAPGHVARIAADLAAAEAALRAEQLDDARRAAKAALAFAREEGDPLAAAAAERILMELAARAGRTAETRSRAHRAARAYTGRVDAGDGPARLLHALGHGLLRAQPRRAERYLEAARRCYERLEAQGFRAPPGS